MTTREARSSKIIISQFSGDYDRAGTMDMMCKRALELQAEII